MLIDAGGSRPLAADFRHETNGWDICNCSLLFSETQLRDVRGPCVQRIYRLVPSQLLLMACNLRI